MTCAQPMTMISSVALAVLLMCFQIQAEWTVPPTLPMYWTTGFQGTFLDATHCKHSGFMYYNGKRKLLRTDWMLGPECLNGNGFRGKQDINDGMNNVIRNYHVGGNSSSFECELIPLPGWWDPGYLQRAQLVGSENITFDYVHGVAQTVETVVYNSTGLFIAGYTLSYVGPQGNLLRMQVMQGPHENYYVDFVNFKEVSAAQVGPEAFMGIPNVSCRKI
eukprot:gene15222-629_t